MKYEVCTWNSPLKLPNDIYKLHCNLSYQNVNFDLLSLNYLHTNLIHE